MTWFSQKTLLMSACVCFAGSISNAYPVTHAPSQTAQQPQFGIKVAQANLDGLSDADLRRLNFYTTRALDALVGLAAADSVTGSEGVALSEQSINSLSDAVAKLIDAGDRSGLSQDDVADFFFVAVSEQFTQEIPLVLQDASGQIGTRAMFEGIVSAKAQQSVNEGGADYLALLNAESADLDLGIASQPEPVEQRPETVVVVEIEGPTVPAGADSATREIIERIFVVNGDWKIEVVQGDSLATYASAVYGNSLAYRQIFAANQTILSNANSLDIGQILTIPKP